MNGMGESGTGASSTGESAGILYAVSDGMATITFNRPAVMNALDADMIRGFCAAAGRAASRCRSPPRWWACPKAP